MPYSDPLADGPVIHEAGTRALAAGANVAGVLEVARALAPSVPVVLMCYANMVFAPGVDAFVERLARTGACGLIVPDLPHGEAPEVPAGLRAARDRARAARRARRRPPERLAAIGAEAQGFVYTVSVVGTTGERRALGERFAEVVGAHQGQRPTCRSRSASASRTPEQAAEAADAGADGVIVGHAARARRRRVRGPRGGGRRGRGGPRRGARGARRSGWPARIPRAWVWSSPPPPASIVWIVLWALGAKGFDAFMIATVIILIGATLKILSGYLPGRRS